MIESETLTPEEREDITGALLLLTSAAEAIENKPGEVQAEFSCPVCGGRAVGWRNPKNRHIHAHCMKCSCCVGQ